MARRRAKKKTGCLFPALIILLLLGLIGSLGDNDSSAATPTTARTTVTETTAPAAKASVNPTTTAVAMTEIPASTHGSISALMPAPTVTPAPKPTFTAAPAKAAEQTYVLNKNTKKFHYASCSSAKRIKDSNRATFTGTREEVIRKGYSPCGNCHP